MREEGDRPNFCNSHTVGWLEILPGQQHLPPTDAKRVLPLTPVPCGGGLGDALRPSVGVWGQAPRKRLCRDEESELPVIGYLRN
jgi:hypothetical protein